MNLNILNLNNFLNISTHHQYEKLYYNIKLLNYYIIIFQLTF